MSKKVYLHIGHYKTGTSAIQAYLHKNAAELRRLGFLYPSKVRRKGNPTNHGHLSLPLARDHGFTPPSWYTESSSTDESFSALDSELASADENNAIISSEEFVQLALCADRDAALEDIKKRFGAYEVKVLLYVREPFSLLKSWYNQVNKAPTSTRTFPTFFMNVHNSFLSQEEIWKFYAEAFGADNVLIKTYGSVGATHIQGFLDTLNCPLQVLEGQGLVNQGQPSEFLEIERLTKRRTFTYEQATISDIKSIDAFCSKVEEISSAYSRLTRKCEVPVPSHLTPTKIINHYASLLQSASKFIKINQDEAFYLRDMAIRAELKNLPLASALMDAARVIRPGGPMILQKCSEYRARLDSEANIN